MAEDKKFEEIILEDGRKAKKWENGSVTEYDTGRIIVPSHGFQNQIIRTSEQGAEMVEKRHAKRREVIEEHVRKASGAFSTDEALGKIVAARVSVALEDKTRAGNDAAKLVLQVLEAMPDSRKEAVVKHEHELSPRAMELLREVARQRGDPDAEYLEADYADG